MLPRLRLYLSYMRNERPSMFAHASPEQAPVRPRAGRGWHDATLLGDWVRLRGRSTGSCPPSRPLGPSCASVLGVAEEARSRWDSWLAGCWVDPMHPQLRARRSARPLTADVRPPCHPLTPLRWPRRR
eukprot:6180928-Pleurochrysis_carterae.AAC.5